MPKFRTMNDDAIDNSGIYEELDSFDETPKLKED